MKQYIHVNQQVENSMTLEHENASLQTWYAAAVWLRDLELWRFDLRTGMCHPYVDTSFGSGSRILKRGERIRRSGIQVSAGVEGGISDEYVDEDAEKRESGWSTRSLISIFAYLVDNAASNIAHF